jgi:hypothetical protein
MQAVSRKMVQAKEEKGKFLPIRRDKITAKRLTYFLIGPMSSIMILTLKERKNDKSKSI